MWGYSGVGREGENSERGGPEPDTSRDRFSGMKFGKRSGLRIEWGRKRGEREREHSLFTLIHLFLYPPVSAASDSDGVSRVSSFSSPAHHTSSHTRQWWWCCARILLHPSSNDNDDFSWVIYKGTLVTIFSRARFWWINWQLVTSFLFFQNNPLPVAILRYRVVSNARIFGLRVEDKRRRWGRKIVRWETCLDVQV